MSETAEDREFLTLIAFVKNHATPLQLGNCILIAHRGRMEFPPEL